MTTPQEFLVNCVGAGVMLGVLSWRTPQIVYILWFGCAVGMNCLPLPDEIHYAVFILGQVVGLLTMVNANALTRRFAAWIQVKRSRRAAA